MHIALALMLTAAQPTLLPRDSAEVRELRLQLDDLERVTRIQTLISIGVSLLLGIAIGTGAACFAVWNAPRFGAPLGVCGR